MISVLVFVSRDFEVGRNVSSGLTRSNVSSKELAVSPVLGYFFLSFLLRAEVQPTSGSQC